MNKIKAYLLLLTIALSAFAAACSSDDNDPVTPEITISENILANGMSFSKAGGTNTLSVKSNVTLEVTSNQDWCVVTPAVSASATVFKYTIDVKSNSTTDNRTSVITVKGGNLTETFNVIQTATEGLDLETVLFEDISAAGGTITVKVMTNGEPTITINDSWITEKTETRAMVDKTKTFIIAANTGKERTGTITFILGDLPATTVTVKQLAGGEISSNEIAGEDPWTVAKSLGLGWNLGNQLDAHNSGVANETAWGNQKTTQALFDKLAAAGITTVRIPVTWMGHIGDAPGYEIEKAWMDRVAEVVGYAENAGLNAIVNIHHDGADSEYWLSIKDAAQDETKNTAIKTELKAVWTQIAERFKDKGNFLAFESMNEIHDGGWGWGDNRNDGGKQYSILNDWNQVFVDAVRAVGGGNSNRFLGVPGYCTNVALTVSNFKLQTDKVQNRLMVSVHFYDPNEYTLDAKYSEWGHTGAADKKANWGDEDNVKDVFNSLKTTYIDKGIPVYIGEMGCVSRTTDRAESFRKYYLEYICKAAKEYGLAPVYWDNGGTGSGKEESGLFNHATGDYLNNAAEIVEVMKKAIFTEDASYTLQSVYDNAPQ